MPDTCWARIRTRFVSGAGAKAILPHLCYIGSNRDRKSIGLEGKGYAVGTPDYSTSVIYIIIYKYKYK